MKLAEALQERADLDRRLSQLEMRLSSNALVQEGEKPAEQPEKLLKELDGCLARQQLLVTKINLTNTQTQSELGTLTELLAKRDAMKKRINILQSFLQTASHIAGRASRSEIKVMSTVNVEQLQDSLDEYSKKLRELDNHIQMLNWQTDLL